MTAEEVIELIKARKIAYMYALDEAQNDAPIGDDEYYESDEYYETVIQTLTNILAEIEEKK